MHIAVVGSGAVGGFYGARLALTGHKVTFVARGAHLKAMRERGLLVWSSALGDFMVHAAAESDTSKVGPVDVVMFAVKNYDLEQAAAMLPPLVGPETMVLTLQNGVDAPDQVARVVGRSHVVAGATYIGTAILAPGLIEHTGTNRRIVFGEYFDAPAEVSPRVATFADALQKADVVVEAHADMRVPLWEKFLFLAPMGSVAAAARVATGGIWGDPTVKALMIAGVREVEAVARRTGIALPDDVVDRIIKYCDALPAAMRPSMFIDISAGKPIEVEALPGSVARRGAELGVPTPVMSTLYAVLKPHGAGKR